MPPAKTCNLMDSEAEPSDEALGELMKGVTAGLRHQSRETVATPKSPAIDATGGQPLRIMRKFDTKTAAARKRAREKAKKAEAEMALAKAEFSRLTSR